MLGRHTLVFTTTVSITHKNAFLYRLPDSVPLHKRDAVQSMRATVRSLQGHWGREQQVLGPHHVAHGVGGWVPPEGNAVGRQGPHVHGALHAQVRV